MYARFKPCRVKEFEKNKPSTIEHTRFFNFYKNKWFTFDEYDDDAILINKQHEQGAAWYKRHFIFKETI